MFEEVSTLVVAVAIAGALLAVGAVLFAYFSPQQPVDHANAAFFPLVKPLNGTHVQLGVKPLADYVEVAEVAWSRNGTQGRAPVRVVARNATWLTYGGRPVAVPCGANVTVATRYGAASRALSFHVACIERETTKAADVTEVYRQLTSYASYVANYVLYRSTPALTAYVKFGSMHVGLQNIAPFTFYVTAYRQDNWLNWPPPAFWGITLFPLEQKAVWSPEAAEPLDWHITDVTSVMYRWIHMVVDWGDVNVMRIWLNGALAYNGTPPRTNATYETPQGFLLKFRLLEGGEMEVSLQYRRFSYYQPPCLCYWKRGGLEWAPMVDESEFFVSTIATRGRVAEWRGWARLVNVWGPASAGFSREIYAMPPAPYVNSRSYALIPPFVVRSVTALNAEEKAYVSWAEANGTLRTAELKDGPLYIELQEPQECTEGKLVYLYAGNHSGDFRAVALGLRCVFSEVLWRWLIEPFWYTKNAECYLPSDTHLWCRYIGSITWSVSGDAVTVQHGDYQRTTSFRNRGAAAYRAGDVVCAATQAGLDCGTDRASAPLAFRWDYSGAYRYRATLSIKLDQKIIQQYQLGNTITYLYNVTYVGALNFTYNGEPVAVDAFYGWYLKRVTVVLPPPPPPPYDPPSEDRIRQTCIPNKIKVGEEQIHEELRKDDGGYTVRVVNYATFREVGCGIDRTYNVTVGVWPITVNGTQYQVTDTQGNVCGYQRACNMGGQVVCLPPNQNRCPNS